MYEGITFRGKAYRVNLLSVGSFVIAALFTAFRLEMNRS